MALIALEELNFRYPEASALALDEVSLCLEAGDFVLIIGPSGCGKTTLLRSLKTVLAPYGKRGGRVLFDGRPLDEVPEREQAARIGFVMQNPEAQIVTDTVWHELAFGLESLGCDQAVMRRRVAEMASYFGIQHWFHRKVDELSGGQKQLLNLASVMAMEPDVLLLDEPTSQLDPIAAETFLATVRKINRDLGVTVVMVEHRLEEVYAMADVVVAMDRGRVVAQGAPRMVAMQLIETASPMAAALPSAARIYEAVADGDGSLAGADGLGRAAEDAAVERAAMPLTVREGREWLAAETAAFPPAVRSLPEESPCEFAHATSAARLKDVWFRYERDGADVLRGASLEVPEGSFYALVGGNGTGKSTLLRALCGAVRPYRGKVEVLGRPLKAWKGTDLFRGGVAMLPQDPLNLMVKSTVRADLEEMAADRGLSPEDRDHAVGTAAARACAEGLLNAHPFDLSGGELQRAALAKVLLCEPRLLLLDEPTKGLDAWHKRRLAATLAELTAEGVTVMTVSHDVEFCAAYADRVALFFDGDVVAADSPRGFFAANAFYTTAASRISRGIFQGAVTDREVIELCCTGRRGE